jgi:hypothetical protein
MSCHVILLGLPTGVESLGTMASFLGFCIAIIWLCEGKGVSTLTNS